MTKTLKKIKNKLHNAATIRGLNVGEASKLSQAMCDLDSLRLSLSALREGEQKKAVYSALDVLELLVAEAIEEKIS